MEKIKLEITIDEANAILAALGQQPYLKVADLIQKIQGQGSAQMNQTSASQAETVAAEIKHSEILETA